MGNIYYTAYTSTLYIIHYRIHSQRYTKKKFFLGKKEFRQFSNQIGDKTIILKKLNQNIL